VPYYKSLEEEIDPGKNSSEFTFSQPYEREIDELLNENESRNENNNVETQEEESDEVEVEPMELRRSARTSHPSTRLHDYVTYKVQYPIQIFLSYQNVTTEYKAFLTAISKEVEPNTYQEALTNPVWCKTMQEEIKTLEKK
jgi:hypothetical protein